MGIAVQSDNIADTRYPSTQINTTKFCEFETIENIYQDSLHLSGNMPCVFCRVRDYAANSGRSAICACSEYSERGAILTGPS